MVNAARVGFGEKEEVEKCELDGRHAGDPHTTAFFGFCVDTSTQESDLSNRPVFMLHHRQDSV